VTRPGRALLVVLVALVASSCAVKATVDVQVHENGSGVVRLLVDADAEAVRAAESGGVPLEQAVRLDDLDAGGWTVGAWTRADDGSASIVLTKPFETPEQVADIIREASGDNGPLRLAASRESGLLATKYGVAGKVDLENVSTGVPTDTELLTNLSAQSVDPTVIDQQLLAQLKASFALKVVVRLPGAAPQTITAKPGAVTPVGASASVRNTARLLFLLAALGLVVLAVVLWRRDGRPRRRRAAPRPPAKRPPARDRPKPGPGQLEGPRRRPGRPPIPHPHEEPHGPHDPRPHVPEPHLPHEEPHRGPHDPRPHVPEPHLPHEEPVRAPHDPRPNVPQPRPQPNRPQPGPPGPPGRPRPGAPPPPRRRPGPPT
jgi:hypothetical protein